MPHATFDDTLQSHGRTSLKARSVSILQVNVGKLCNQACKHCHVDAGPHRTEIISRETVDDVLRVLERNDIPTLDITGGAPELVPDFRYLVQAAVDLGKHVIVRHNLTVQFEAGFNDLPEFFASNGCEVVASLPYFLAQQTDNQRGVGVFDKSLAALIRLNGVGYGVPGSPLVLNLVYNPVGAFLPPEQSSIERDFKKELRTRYGISFSNLYTITNMPISRFLHYLERSGNLAAYMDRLVNAFNPSTLDNVMCRDLVSVSWDGRLFDCDFNQMLELPLIETQQRSIKDFDMGLLTNREIATRDHCYGCTAGSGSSCGGTIAS